ncbi:hypothetical protein [Microbacterium halophytorum]|uniref:hypothetical protein n=1 Tax=Microbacterium halophytorum TaxID=2067568 RepID=UPI000CFDE654|nr:hypothetical protein [Microbacterium halophytorum]
MARRDGLPAELGGSFTVGAAREMGVGAGRLRGSDLERPFRGVRTYAQEARDDAGDFDRVRGETVRLAEAYSVRMRETEFFAYETAVHLLGGPLPVAIGRELRDLDVGVHGDAPLPRCAGVRGRRLGPHLAPVVTRRGIRMSSPASTWAMLGTWSVPDLVALGDFLCRVWREGYGRRSAGTPPLTTPEQLRAALGAGKRRGAARLRTALELIRCDAWSPRESACRVHLVEAGLPEPELNVDVFDRNGFHLGCVDLVYRRWKVAIEYQGKHHRDQYAHDVERVERVERLRAAGWAVVQVTSALHAEPARLVTRVESQLSTRGWRR